MPRSRTAPEAAPPREAARGWFRHRLGAEELRAWLTAFERAAIPVIPLKGPLLAEALYDDPGLRPFTDLDLLVRTRDVPRAVELLGTLGYRALEWERPLAYELAHATAACFVPAGPTTTSLPIDLHWGLVGFPAGATPRAFDAEEVWTRAVTEERWGRPILQLCREDLLLYLALHLAVHHPLDGLPWQLDLALLIRRGRRDFAWERVTERARRWHAAGAAYFALRLVEDRFTAGVPVSVLAGLRPRGLRGALLDGIGRRSGVNGGMDHLVDLLLLDRMPDLCRAVAAAVAPRPSWVRSRYATSSAFRGYLAHFVRIGKILSRRRTCLRAEPLLQQALANLPTREKAAGEHAGVQ